MNKTLILFAHGARDPEWAGPVRAVAQRLQTENPDLPVVIAFLEFMSPSLPEAIDKIVRQTSDLSQQIDILPFFIAQGGHLRQEVPVMLAAVREQYPQLQLRLLPPLGELPAVQDAIAVAINGLL
jgi:sirohydrochlorin cobaltochelatase